MTLAEDRDAHVSIDDLVRQYFGPRPKQVEFQFGAGSHRGNVREQNEDHYLVTRRQRSREVLSSNLPEDFLQTYIDNAFVMVVADGMGGPAFGKLASMLALRVGMNLATDEYKWSMKVDEKEADEIKTKMELFLKLMDRELVEQSNENSELYGMGTTLTGAYTVGDQAFICHVGDSRAFLLRDGTLRQLTWDHTLANQLKKAGMVSANAPHYKRMTHVLTNCLGGGTEGVDVEIHHIELKDEDMLLLCSDGLTDSVTEKEIESTLQGSSDCQETVNVLIEKALDLGGKDNITVILSKYGIDSEPVDAEAPTAEYRP